MPSYIVFLRAINLGAKRKVPMAALRAVLEEAGYQGVETYIHTGNVTIRTDTRSAAKVEKDVEALLGDRFGFDIPAIVFTPSELRRVCVDVTAFEPREGVAGERRYVILFKPQDAPTAAEAEAISAWDGAGEAGQVVGRAAIVWIDGTMQGAGILGKFKKVLDPGTNRNVQVLTAVCERWAQ